MKWTATIGLAVVVGVLAAPAASAQVELGPQVGLYAPNGAIVEVGSVDNPATYTKKRQEGSLLVGVRGLYWVTQRLGVAANLAYSPSPTAVTDSLGTSDVSGGLFLASAQLVAGLTPQGGDFNADVGVGAGLVSRRGSEWNYSSGKTAPALVVSVGAGLPLYSLGAEKPYPPAKLVLRIEATDYITHTQFDKGLPTETPAVTHHDFVAAVMFSFYLHR